MGLPSRLRVMSGFRTPRYDAGVFVDADGNWMMDDLNRDGTIAVADAKVLRAAAGRVKARW